MIVAAITFLVALAFAASPFLFPDFRGFAPELFPVPQVDQMVQPAPYAFGIWGVIYLWLVLGAGYGLVFRTRHAAWARMRPALTLSMALGTLWLAVAQMDPLLATALLWAMWAASVGALARSPVGDLTFGVWPVGLYAGWLTAAASVASALCLAGFGLVDEKTAALAGLGIAIALSAGVLLSLRRAATFGLAVIWALVGIFAANQTTQVDVAGLAAGGAMGVALVTLWAVIQGFRRRA